MLIDNYIRYNLCPLCQSGLIKKVGFINYPRPINFCDQEIDLKLKAEYWKCQKCSSFFTQNVLDEKTTRSLYSDTKVNKWPANSFAQEKGDKIIETVSSLIDKNTNILDIGCSNGALLDFLKEQGAKTFGVEYSKITRSECLNKGHQVFGSFSEIPGDLKFNLVFAFDLFEHLYDPPSFLDTCSDLLATGGQLAVLTGNPNCLSARISKNRWWYLIYPEHIIFPSKKYFSNLKRYKMEKYIKVFNSVGWYEASFIYLLNKFNILKFLLSITRLFRRLRSYNGIPLLDKDHALVVLMKK